MARGAGGESVMSNIEEHQKGEQNLSQDEFGERDQSKGQMKHVVASNPEEREIEKHKRNGIDSDHINSYNNKQQPNNPPEIDVINVLNLGSQNQMA